MDLIIKPTELCNFKCTFCSSTNIDPNNAGLLDHKYIFRFLKRFPETNTIIVNGGDPLMMKPDYYWKIIDYLDEHDLPATLSLTTNLWPFYINPDKWVDLFNHKRVGIGTSFQYGVGRLKGDLSPFTEEDFWNVSDKMLELVGYRPDFIAVITEENEDTVMKTVELAKKMNVECKVNYAMASGKQSAPYRLSKIYSHYVNIWKAGLSNWEHNTKQMMKRLRGDATICPLSRNCDENIRALQPEGDYYSCGAFGDDRDKPIEFEIEMNGVIQTPLSDDLNLNHLKEGCYGCNLFQICNGCKKTIKDLKEHNMVDAHCFEMKTLEKDILKANELID